MLRKTLIILIGLFVFSLNPNSQDPPKESQDSIQTAAVRPADSLYIQQKNAKMKLDSIYNEKKKK